MSKAALVKAPAEVANKKLVALAGVAALAVTAISTVGYLAGRPASVAQQPAGQTSEAPTSLEVAEIGHGPDAGGQAEAAASDVRAASTTFRNGTLLIAIRRAGFYCDDVATAYESAEGVWVASCVDKGGYRLTVRDTDRFDVAPVPHYFDGVAPVFRRDFPEPGEEQPRR
jgi:hypothetical protein